MCKSIKMRKAPSFEVLQEFSPFAPILKDGEIILICPKCCETYVVRSQDLS